MTKPRISYFVHFPRPLWAIPFSMGDANLEQSVSECAMLGPDMPRTLSVGVLISDKTDQATTS